MEFREVLWELLVWMGWASGRVSNFLEGCVGARC